MTEAAEHNEVPQMEGAEQNTEQPEMAVVHDLEIKDRLFNLKLESQDRKFTILSELTNAWVGQLTNELQHLSNELQQMRNELQQLRNELQRMRNEQQQNVEKIANLEEKCQQLDEVANLKEKYQQFQLQIIRMQLRLSDLEENNGGAAGVGSRPL